jgi:hypothetical protein
MAAFEVVEGHRHISGARQRLARMASNKPGTASYEDRLHAISCGITGRSQGPL